MTNNSLVSKSRVKLYMQQNGSRVGKSVYETLDEKIRTMLLEASERSKKNGRVTILEHDL